MRLPKFAYSEPASLAEASSILAENPGAKVLAGGTDLLVNMKHRLEIPERIVNIKKIKGLDAIREDRGAIRIGSLVRLKKIAESPEIRQKLPVLASAASAVGSYHHQTMGTIGGNLCQQNRCRYFNQSKWWRSARDACFKAGGQMCHVMHQKEVCFSAYCGDMAPALLVLGAEAVLESTRGARQTGLEELFSGDGKAPLLLAPGEILTEIVVPGASADGFAVYLKLANRKSIDFPIVGAAFWACPEERAYRVAFTAVDRKSVRAHTVEKELAGKELHEASIADLAGAVSKDAKPVKTSVYSPALKRRLMQSLLEQAAGEIIRRKTP